MNGPSFRFRLERVRALRERKEDLARQEVAVAISELSDSRERLATVEESLAHAHAEQRELTSEVRVSSGDELLARQSFLERVEVQRELGASELARSEALLAERDAKLSEAARDHEMLERLKERHQAAHDREVDRQESNTLDEIAMDRFRRSAA